MKPIHYARLLLASLTVSGAVAFGQTPGTPAGPGTASDMKASQPGTTPDAVAAETSPTTPTEPMLPPSKILPAPEPGTPAAGTLTGSLEAGRVASLIQVRELTEREELLNEVSERVAAADQKLAELRQRTTNLDETQQKSVETAVAQYEKMKTNLNQSLEAAKTAEKATWDRARARLASDYAFFVSAVGGVEVALPN